MLIIKSINKWKKIKIIKSFIIVYFVIFFVSENLSSRDFLNPTCAISNSSDGSYFVSTYGSQIDAKGYHNIGNVNNLNFKRGGIYQVVDSNATAFAYADESNFKMELDNNNLYVCGLDNITVIPINKSKKKKLRLDDKKIKGRNYDVSISRIRSFCKYKTNKLLVVDANNNIFEYNVQNGSKNRLMKRDSTYLELDSTLYISDITYNSSEEEIILSTKNYEKPIIVLDEDYNQVDINHNLKIPLSSLVVFSSNEVICNSPLNGNIYKINLRSGSYSIIGSDYEGSGYLTLNNNLLYIPLTNEGIIQFLEIQ